MLAAGRHNFHINQVHSNNSVASMTLIAAYQWQEKLLMIADGLISDQRPSQNLPAFPFALDTLKNAHVTPCTIRPDYAKRCIFFLMRYVLLIPATAHPVSSCRPTSGRWRARGRGRARADGRRRRAGCAGG